MFQICILLYFADKAYIILLHQLIDFYLSFFQLKITIQRIMPGAEGETKGQGRPKNLQGPGEPYSKKHAKAEQNRKNLQGDGSSKDKPKAPGYKTPGYVPTGNPRGRPKKTE